MITDCIIMAGGSGTRLWPASRSNRPKQFLPIAGKGPEKNAGEPTFFSEALARALAVIGTSGEVIIIAGKDHVPHIIETCGHLAVEERRRCVLIPEPAAKNTAAAIACGVMYADLVFGQERNMLVLTSDHIIQPVAVFKADVAAAFIHQGKLAVFGIPPQGPSTGYGYIEVAEPLSRQPGSREPVVWRVASFREKPDRQQAEAFLAQGHFYWNSGMFAFSSRFMLREFADHAPEVIGPFKHLEAPAESSYTVTQGLRILGDWPGLPAAYREAKNISFDYAIAEKSEQTVMVAADFEWRDVGSWDEYSQLVGDTGAEVYCSGRGVRGCFVDSDIPVALCGVEDLIVVVRSGKDGAAPTVLIAKKGATQEVKEIVEKIKAAGRTELL
ncbi:MAG: NTP transferase domain-containing protein [Treponema sp.]|jgi:mannose-1-phosphate guanylyltransferase/mannose-1-phosphate guanylyltransferase/mannose-6-phosphate isomerase|nr:NTP transferase domain-containing protein [Treponema sp.]